jgi:Raf kinase inhibitor-like YbhB/YbcL family protein
MRGAALAFVMLAASAQTAEALTLSSADLRDGASMPQEQIYSSCGGRNVSPGLAWNGAPAATRSLVLTMIDLDVKPRGWSHWIIVDIPPTATGIEQGAGVLAPPAEGVKSNMESDRYAGPCPPAGSGVHHYEVTIWAMPTAHTTAAANGPANALRASLEAASIAHASITATAWR